MRRLNRYEVGGWWMRLAGIVLLGTPCVGEAREFRVAMLPNGNVVRCANCHVSSSGGGQRTPFGNAVRAITGSGTAPFWSAALAALDSDGDGVSNGAELGDPDGDGTPIAGATITNPGDANSRPPSNVAPRVSITSPVNGASLSAPALAAFDVDATDSDGTVAKVEFFSGARLLGVDTTAPFSLLVDWSLGSHMITAKATDDKGAATTSSPVNMMVSPPAATRLTKIARAGANVDLEWTAGGGPYEIQGRTDFGQPWKSVGVVTSALRATILSAGDFAVYRVADMAVGDAISMSATLNGAGERPVVDTPGTGTATIRIEGNTLVFEIQYTGLKAAAVAAHVHGPAGPDGLAGPMIDLAPFNGGAFGTSGTMSGSVVLTLDQKAILLSGNAYVNIHTSVHGGGEIRGQVNR